MLDDAVSELSRLPGIGSKTALRLALHLLRQDKTAVNALGNSLIQMKENIKECKVCHNISDEDFCNICKNPRRNPAQICVVESIKDVLTIENTRQFTGLYHVLGGIISPMDGIGPNDLTISSLQNRLSKNDIDEVILALPTTMEGDTTNYYIYRKIAAYEIAITTIARGVAIGDNLEYTDEITLGRSILNRIKFKA